MAMRFSFYLPCYWPDLGYPAQRMYQDAVDEAQLAEDLGFDTLCIPEHHFINYLTHPQPLLTAVKVAAATRAIKIITSVLVLPIYDIRRLAGEVCQTDCLTDGRIEIGVGRGAFAYEFDRFNVPPEESRARFDDSLALLEALLTGKETGWKSAWYDFEPVTITPHAVQKPIPIWIAALSYPAIYHSAKRGYHIQTTPLRGGMETVKTQATAFNDAVRDAEGTLDHLKFSMLRMLYVARDQADADEKVAMAYENHRRFCNVYDTPGTVKDGAIVPIDVEESIDDVRDALLIGTAPEIIDKLGAYDELKVMDLLLNMGFGASHEDVMGSMERFARDVMPFYQKENSA
jgi:alkanesulfonate monooxygenase SsuD/methylene tetrahydromethanopterin reductase-like flavin-dependent oxidoreductase (luciferase family)